MNMSIRIPDRSDVRPLLDRWVKKEQLRAVDRAFVHFLMEQEPDAPALLLVAAALTSFYSSHGNSCLDLTTLGSPKSKSEPELELEPEETPETFLGSWSGSELVAQLRYPALTEPEGPAPLALVEQAVPRLYLKKYFRFEQTIRNNIEKRLADTVRSGSPGEIDPRRVRTVLDELFPDRSSSEPDWQRIACALALRNRFSVVTGGPGTGKTTTVVRLLAAACLLGNDSDRPLRIRLAAPTGKAANRLQESIDRQRDEIPPRVRDRIPRKVSTLHRLLGIRGPGRVTTYSHSDPLPADLVVVDEASMMDVEMTARLLDALPDHARVVLLGDKDQLASVEAGAVLADLCSRADSGGYTTETAQWVQSATGQQIPRAMQVPSGNPLDQAITMLRISHRFSVEGGIGMRAEAVRRGDSAAAAQESADTFKRVPVGDPGETTVRTLLGTYRDYLETMATQKPAETTRNQAVYDNWARHVLNEFSRFQVLCALREGPWGVSSINTIARETLEQMDLIPPEVEWYPGRPVIVTRNDYRLGVMNGDVGMTLQPPEGLCVAFDRGREQGIYWVSPLRLHAVETVFAMTVHKSQGSEFDHVVLVLPDRDVPVLTRELVYTAITRARATVTLLEANPEILPITTGRCVKRTGGLASLLEGLQGKVVLP